MAAIRRVVLDVLKPHQPNPIAFSSALADLGMDYRVNLDVIEVDERTETTLITIEGADIDFERIASLIEQMGASIHSIDEVDVTGSAE